MVNVSPGIELKLRTGGFTEWLPDDSRRGMQNFMVWLCDRALQIAEQDDAPAFYDEDTNLIFTFALTNPATRSMSWWKLTFELLDERASLYDLSRVERLA